MIVVTSAEGVEMIRDGGSLALYFSDETGRPLTLFLSLRKRHGPDGILENLGFDQPHLITPYNGECDTDTKRYSKLLGPAVAILWEEARLIVQQAEMLLPDLTPWRAEWFDALRHAVATDGGLPQSYKRRWGEG